MFFGWYRAHHQAPFWYWRGRSPSSKKLTAMFSFAKTTENFSEKQIAAGVTAIYNCSSSSATEDEFGCVNPNGNKRRLNITAFGAADEAAIEATLNKAKGIVVFRSKSPFTKSGMKSFAVTQGPNIGTHVVAMVSTKGDASVDVDVLDAQKLNSLGITRPSVTISEPATV